MLFPKRWLKEVFSLALVLTGVFCFRYSIAQAYVVPTGSMEPTILPGDRLWVLKTAYDLKVPFTSWVISRVNEPKRGEVVVFKSPVDPKTDLIKRLIAIPGDQVEVADGRISINGQALEYSFPEANADGEILTLKENLDGKPHAIQRYTSRAKDGRNLRFRVPQDEFFFMGDNRDRSYDSRFWGFVNRSQLQGKALVVWLSLDTQDKLIPQVRWKRFGERL